MRRSSAIPIIVALAFPVACKKTEPVQQVAPTETGPIVVASSSSAPSATPSVAASAPSASVAASSVGVGVGVGVPSIHSGTLGLIGDGVGHAPEDDMFARRHLSQVRFSTITVTGKLPPEVVRRVVRMKFPQFRACYDAGLQKNPKLQGRVTAKYTIGSDGAVTSSSDGGSDLPDPSVVACVVKMFGTLTYPRPEAGTVDVVFPLVFSPSE